MLQTTLNTDPPRNPKNPPEPEPAKLSYEATFSPSSVSSQSITAFGVTSSVVGIEIPWKEFVPTYRGKKVESTDPRYKPLQTDSIYEMSLMCRSGFGKQSGVFDLVILSIGAIPRRDSIAQGMKGGAGDEVYEIPRGWLGWFRGVWDWIRSWVVASEEGMVRLEEEKESV